jgi:hypothetical protein
MMSKASTSGQLAIMAASAIHAVLIGGCGSRCGRSSKIVAAVGAQEEPQRAHTIVRHSRLPLSLLHLQGEIGEIGIPYS